MYQAVRPTGQATGNTQDMIRELERMGYGESDPIIATLEAEEVVVTDDDVVGYMKKETRAAVALLRDVIGDGEYAEMTKKGKIKKLKKMRDTAKWLKYNVTEFDTEIIANSPMMGSAL